MKIRKIAACFAWAMMAFVCLSGQGLAFMTPFNDTGNWQFGSLPEAGGGNTIYRACKNSEDRHSDSQGGGSLAILCVSVVPDENKASLGVWHSEPMPGAEISCGLAVDGAGPEFGVCPVRPSRFAKGQIVLAEDPARILELLGKKSLKVYFGGKSEAESAQPLEFVLDLPALKSAAGMVWEELGRLAKGKD